MNTIIKIFSILFLALTYTSVLAEAKRYDVEIIIFEDAQSRYIQSEEWHHQQRGPRLSSNSTAHYSPIKPYILTSSYKRIKASNEYNVLFYGGWRQTGLSKKRAFSLNLDQLKNRHSSKSGNTISGELKLVLARYLHVYGDLNYQRGDLNYQRSDYSDSVTVTFHDRMRSKELHLIDHPLVGILVQVNPVKEKVKSGS